MTKNPILNAATAIAYIIAVSSFVFFVGTFEDDKIGVLAPIMALSLFTLSAAVMGYIFLSQPLQMIVGGKKKQGVDLFLRTVGSFAVITIAIFLSIFLFTR